MAPNLSYSLAKFAFKFCNELNKSKTIVCSPLSAEILLAMIALNSEGQSRTELMQALDIGDDEAIRSSFAHLTSILQSIDGVTLNMANKVYIKKGGVLKPKAKKDAKEVFASSLEQIDINDKVAAAATINKWVAEKTHGLINNIITPDAFEKESCLVLVNAIYFKGNWKVPFAVTDTKNRAFHVNNSTTIEVPMMYNGKLAPHYKYGVITELKAKILEMRYEGNEASMVIVLPDDIEGLSGVLQQLAGGYDLMADVGALDYSTVTVMIPKFKAEMSINLKAFLPKMGIESIFKFGEILMLLYPDEWTYVSDAVQKAFIEVDETGTEAAVVTLKHTKRIVRRQKPRTYDQFVADRPFLYLLVVRGIPVFVGVYEGSQFAVSGL